MSTSSGDWERVETAEERAARELRTAQGRFRRVAQEAAAFASTAAAAAATYPGVTTPAPAIPDVDSDDTTALTRATDELEAALDLSRIALNAAVAVAETTRLAEFARSLSRGVPEQTLQPAESSDRASEPREQSRDRDRTADVARILKRLPGDCAPGIANEIEAAVSLVMLSTSDAQADLALDSLRTLVQRESTLSRLRAKNRTRLRSLIASLDGLTGTAVDEARSALATVAIDQRLPTELGRMVAAARASAVREADQRIVLEAISQGLETLGYRVEAGFEGEVLQGGAIAMLPGSERHGVNVRMREGQVLLNVVRLDEDGRRDVAADAAAEQVFCAQTGRLSELARARGGELHLATADGVPPGRLQVVRQAPRRKARSSRADVPHERERGRSDR